MAEGPPPTPDKKKGFGSLFRKKRHTGDDADQSPRIPHAPNTPQTPSTQAGSTYQQRPISYDQPLAKAQSFNAPSKITELTILNESLEKKLQRCEMEKNAMSVTHDDLQRAKDDARKYRELLSQAHKENARLNNVVTDTSRLKGKVSNEVQKQMEELALQARDYRRLAEQLRYEGGRTRHFQQLYLKAEQELATASSEILKLGKAVKDLQSGIVPSIETTDLQEKLTKQAREKDKLQKRLIETEEHLKRVEADAKKAVDKAKRDQYEVKKLKQQIAVLKADKETDAELIKKLERQADNLNVELSKADQEIKQKAATIAKLRTQVRDLQTQVEELNVWKSALPASVGQPATDPQGGNRQSVLKLRPHPGAIKAIPTDQAGKQPEHKQPEEQKAEEKQPENSQLEDKQRENKQAEDTPAPLYADASMQTDVEPVDSGVSRANIRVVVNAADRPNLTFLQKMKAALPQARHVLTWEGPEQAVTDLQKAMRSVDEELTTLRATTTQQAQTIAQKAYDMEIQDEELAFIRQQKNAAGKTCTLEAHSKFREELEKRDQNDKMTQEIMKGQSDKIAKLTDEQKHLQKEKMVFWDNQARMDKLRAQPGYREIEDEHGGYEHRGYEHGGYNR
jgi:hypothetical protein